MVLNDFHLEKMFNSNWMDKLIAKPSEAKAKTDCCCLETSSKYYWVIRAHLINFYNVNFAILFFVSVNNDSTSRWEIIYVPEKVLCEADDRKDRYKNVIVWIIMTFWTLKLFLNLHIRVSYSYLHRVLCNSSSWCGMKHWNIAKVKVYKIKSINVRLVLF